MRWKDFLYFQRNSKIGVILLLILILLTLILNAFLSYRRSSDVVLMQNDSLVREFDQFRRSLTVRDPTASTNTPGVGESRTVRSSRWSGTTQEKIRRETDLREIASGESAAQESTNNQNATHGNAYQGNASRNENGYLARNKGNTSSSVSYSFTGKFSQGETISLNNTDTTEWKKVPGIGSAFASRIVKYRDLLGGFVHLEQLLDVYGIDQDLFARISPYIEPDGDYKKVKVNRSEFNDLLRHPYLNYKQVQAIMSVRRRKGDITSIRELSMLNEFTSEDVLRLEPYLEF